MSLFGHFKNGVIVPDERVPLPEGAQVRIEILTGETAVSGQEHNPALAERFHRLAEQWREAVKPLSSVTRMVQHPAYQQIIALGSGVVPLLLQELERQPDHWFAALKALTGASPVAAEDRGQLDRMAAAWLHCGRQQ
jgi:hypothetical protein